MRRLVSAIGRGARGLLDGLRHRAFVVFVMSLLTVLYGLGLVVPQRRSVPGETWQAWRDESPHLVALLERSGLADVYRAPGTWVAVAFFFLSLGAVVVDRLPRMLRRTRLEHGLPLELDVVARRKGTVELRTADAVEAVRRAGALLSAAGYALHAPTQGAVRGVRFRMAPLGFVLFHGAFVLLLAGGLSVYATRFSGIADVADGETFDASTGEYAARPRTPLLGDTRPDVSFTVAGVRPRSDRGFPIALEVGILPRGESAPRAADINRPVRIGSTSVLVLSAGPTPLFTCTWDGAGDGTWVKLVPNPSGRSRFLLEPCGLDVLARPLAADPEGAPAGREQGVMLANAGVARLEDVSRTGIEVAIRGPDGAVARGVLRPGDSLATPDGRRVLRMPEIRYYARLQIVAERGGGLLWAGFLAGTLGLVLRLVLFRREVVVLADPPGGRVLLAAAADAQGWRPEIVERLVSALGSDGEARSGAPPA